MLFQTRVLKDKVPIRDSDGESSCPTEVVGVLVQPKEPSSLSVKETMFQRGQEDEDEDLDAKITRRVQRAARRKAKQEQLKRLHKAQVRTGMIGPGLPEHSEVDLVFNKEKTETWRRSYFFTPAGGSRVKVAPDVRSDLLGLA